MNSSGKPADDRSTGTRAIFHVTQSPLTPGKTLQARTTVSHAQNGSFAMRHRTIRCVCRRLTNSVRQEQHCIIAADLRWKMNGNTTQEKAALCFTCFHNCEYFPTALLRSRQQGPSRSHCIPRRRFAGRSQDLSGALFELQRHDRCAAKLKSSELEM